MEVPAIYFGSIDWAMADVLVGIMGIIVGATIAYVIYRLQRKKKSLVFETPIQTRLLTGSEELREKVEILFEGVPTDNVYLNTIKFQNNGNVSILEDDFVEPIEISFDEYERMLNSEVIETKPPNLNLELALIDDHRLQVVPTVLIQRESFTVKVLTTRDEDLASGDIGVNARIVDVGNVKPMTYYAAGAVNGIFALAIFGMLLAILALIFRPEAILGIQSSLGISGLEMLIIVVIILLIYRVGRLFFSGWKPSE